MWHSLRFRLLASTVLVVIVAVSVTALFASRSTASEFTSYLEHGSARQQHRFVMMLTNAYAQAQTWDGVQPLVEQLGQFTGERAVLADANGKIVGDSGRDLVGKAVNANWSPSGRIVVAGTQVGALYFNSAAKPSPADAGFLATVNRAVLVGAMVAGVVAVLVTLALSHRIVRPVELLTAAARRMETGDLTARVNVASGDEIGELARAFNSMAGGLARLEQLRRNMVSDVAHELRTPLTNIRGYLEAAQDGMIAPDATLVNNLYEEAMLLNRLVDDLRELALAEAGQLHLERQPVDMGDVARAALEAVRARAEERGLQLSLDAPSTEGMPLVEADPHRIRQVLCNLLNNALDFTPRGGRVTTVVQPDGQWVRIEVRDTGRGIAPEHLPFVFERFYRADRSRARATGGAGLGLAIVKQLVEAHGGRVWVTSEPGNGCVFGFILPVTASSS